jgi:hypothetical protein
MFILLYCLQLYFQAEIFTFEGMLPVMCVYLVTVLSKSHIGLSNGCDF